MVHEGGGRLLISAAVVGGVHHGKKYLRLSRWSLVLWWVLGSRACGVYASWVLGSRVYHGKKFKQDAVVMMWTVMFMFDLLGKWGVDNTFLFS